MPAFTFFDEFSEGLGVKVMNLKTDSLKVALTNTAPDPATDDVVADLPTQAVYTFCSTRTITTISWDHVAGVATLLLTNLVLTASGGDVGPFRYVTIFDDTPAGDPLIGFVDRGSSLTLHDTETFTIAFDPVNGLFQLHD